MGIKNWAGSGLVKVTSVPSHLQGVVKLCKIPRFASRTKKLVFMGFPDFVSVKPTLCGMSTSIVASNYRSSLPSSVCASTPTQGLEVE